MKVLKRIYILGPAGGGKSYLAKRISKKLNLPHKDMDDVRFIKKFSKARIKPQRKKLVDAILKTKEWIIDARGTDWDQHAMLKADLIILIKTPFYRRTTNIITRYFKRRNQDLDEKFTDLFPLIKYSWSYRYGKKESSFNKTTSYLIKNNLKPKIIKNRRELRKLVDTLKFIN